jgi:hypothetical protein
MYLEHELNRPLRGRFQRGYVASDPRPIVSVSASPAVSAEYALGACSTLSMLMPDFQVCLRQDLSNEQELQTSVYVVVIPQGADPEHDPACNGIKDVIRREFVVLECGTILRFGHPLLLEIADLHHRRIQAMQPKPCLLLRAWAAVRRYFDLRAAL